MDHLDKPYVVNHDAFGHVKIWKHNVKDGSTQLVVEKPNMIVYGGADVAAKALSGQPNTGITHMYVGISSSNTAATAAQLTDSITTFGTINTNFVKLPIAFSPSFSNEANYTSNLVYFSVYITGSTVTNGYYINSLGLVNASIPTTNPNTTVGDKLFSRITFTPIAYDSSHGLAICWGVTFRAS
jgi:hypothetical protein